MGSAIATWTMASSDKNEVKIIATVVRAEQKPKRTKDRKRERLV